MWMVDILRIVVTVVLYRTVFGRYVFAIGSSEPTARLCGIAVTKVKTRHLHIGWGVCGFSRRRGSCSLGKGDATAGMGLELQIIAACVGHRWRIAERWTGVGAWYFVRCINHCSDQPS